MATTRFLDTNVLLRLITDDDRPKADAAQALIDRIQRGEERVLVSPLVLFEVVFTLQKTYHIDRDSIREAVGSFISLRQVETSNKTVWQDALDLYVRENISFADAFNATYMKAQQVQEIYSWDADFDRIEGIARLEPS